MRVPENVVKVYRGLIQVNENTKMVRNNYYEGRLFCTEKNCCPDGDHDGAGGYWSYQRRRMHWNLRLDTSSDVDIYFYDKYVGGLGFSEKIYDNMEDIIQNAVKLVKRLWMQKYGCAACVGRLPA